VAVWDIPAKLWTFERKIEKLFALQDETEAALKPMNGRLSALELRMMHLEAGLGQVITEVRAAAGMAATGMASAIIADVVTRVTRLEMRQDEGARRLPPG